MLTAIKKRVFIFFLFFVKIGVVAHEYAHKQAAKNQNLAIHEVVYFYPSGKVVHDQPKSYKRMFIVSAAPFILNTSFGFTIFFSIITYINYVGPGSITPTVAAILLFGTWVGISLCIYAFPSSQDIQNIKNKAKQKWDEKPFGILGTPVFLIRHMNILLSLPIILVLLILNRTRKIYSHYIFTAVIVYFAYYAASITTFG